MAPLENRLRKAFDDAVGLSMAVKVAVDPPPLPTFTPKCAYLFSIPYVASLHEWLPSRPHCETRLVRSFYLALPEYRNTAFYDPIRVRVRVRVRVRNTAFYDLETQAETVRK